jgi:5-methylcytosine-specific restriction endonuclease McrA
MSLRRRDHHIGRRLAQRASRAQGGLCYWCQTPMILVKTTPADEPRLMTADHLVPVYAGGLTIAGNIVAACYQCNSGRHNEETNRIKPGATVMTIGDPSSPSPFEILKNWKPKCEPIF